VNQYTKEVRVTDATQPMVGTPTTTWFTTVVVGGCLEHRADAVSHARATAL
jgi:hypothetical protein